ncbi:MAG: diguanylate cyclase [Rubrivivax sp.]|nr:diguanylate cyclase [Rubrivivax sp.]
MLCIGGPEPDLGLSAWGPFALRSCQTLDEAAAALRQGPMDAVLRLSRTDAALDELLHWPALTQVVMDAALVAVVPEPQPGAALKLLQRGAQDVLNAQGLATESLARTLRLAVERKRLEQAARKAYATDLATGLPNHAQLLEHMTHLLALREREPAPMALIVLRIEGLASTEAALGAESANVLRRKVAVRIRSGLRASDVVASLGADAFAVLLAWIDAAGDAPQVAAKLAQMVRQPFKVAGTDRAVAVSLGLAAYPEHGRDADALMRRAVGQAASVVAMGREGFANRVERGPATAANDD